MSNSINANHRSDEILKVTLVGSIVNALLLTGKFLAGILGHSAAMIADAVHSLSDFVTDIIVMLFVRISGKPSDKDHEYGHGKFETLATAIIGILLFGVGVGIFLKGGKSILDVCRGEPIALPGAIAFWAAILSILTKEILYQYTRIVGKKLNSGALISNAWHHRSDALSSIGTALGIGGAILLGEKWAVLDPIAAIIVSVLIIKVSIDILKPCVNDLLEKSVPEAEDGIRKMLSEELEIQDLHNLRTRKVGNTLVVDMHVRMAGNTTLDKAHQKATEIENKIREKYGRETIIIVHVEPYKSVCQNSQ